MPSKPRAKCPECGAVAKVALLRLWHDAGIGGCSECNPDNVLLVGP
jgi:hypothetical protein